jgi:hypothetical protein
MEMRTKAGKANKDGGDKIVRRELASVFTNGTVVDPAFLAGDEASHCVAIKASVLLDLTTKNDSSLASPTGILGGRDKTISLWRLHTGRGYRTIRIDLL